ncbi:MAG: hypothetical protein QOI11_576 [Candidatus Eremiobacteraeota bacterium]|nr:hypothetical protein [Candidatus Eremiobacteraeota bacterium]
MPLVVLLASVRTEVGFWDTGDLQTVAWIAGIPYPTGFPGYVLAGWVWTHLVPLGSVAARLNALSALALAGGAATVAALALALEAVPAAALLAGWAFAFAHPVWLRATYADAHPLGFALAFAAVALGVRWSLRGEPRALAAALVLGGAALAVDNTTVLILAGGVVAALGRPWPLRPVAGGLAVALLLVATAYAWLPLRSAQLSAARADPTLALGIPPGRPFWDDHHPAARHGFVRLVTGSDWGPGDTLAELLTPATVRAAWARFEPGLEADLPAGLLAAAAIGLALAARTASTAAGAAPVAVAGLALAGLLPALFGASYGPEADPLRYAFALYAVLAVGLAVAASRTMRAFGHEAPRTAGLVVVALLALAVGREAARGGDIVAARGERDAVELADRVVRATRDGAVIVATWDLATPLAYRAYVEHGLGRRVVVCSLPGDFGYLFARWLQTRQVAVVGDAPPLVPGLRSKLLSQGDPPVYEMLRR